jgi:hypothetical protein
MTGSPAGGPSPMSWLRAAVSRCAATRSPIASGGDYVIVVHGDQFVIAERAKLGSLDELSRLLLEDSHERGASRGCQATCATHITALAWFLSSS